VVTPASPGKPAEPAATRAAVSIGELKAVILGAKRPKLIVHANLSGATVLDLTLLGPRGHTLGHWRLAVGRVTHTIGLPVRSEALQPGHDTLRVTWTGNHIPRSVGLTVP
jgi:hypothetical protein